jgi:hypothetical protein
MLTVKCVLELGISRIALQALVLARVLGHRLKVTVISFTVSVISGEPNIVVVFSGFSRADGPGSDLSRIFLLGPARAEIDHRLAFSVSKFV